MDKKCQRILGAVLLLLTVSPLCGEEANRCVRFVYLVSSDREKVPAYVEAIEDAARDMRGWYAKQLGGPTFNLADPVVEILPLTSRPRGSPRTPTATIRTIGGFATRWTK